MVARDESLLVQAMARGEATALAALYDRYAPSLVALALRIVGDQAEVEDLIHDVFLEVWGNAAMYRPERGSVWAWLAVRVRSRALDRLRKRQTVAAKLQAPETEELDSVVDGVGADSFRLAAALRGLPPDQRRIIELAFFGGLTSAEMAGQLGIPVGTVKSRIAAAKLALRQKLGLVAAASGEQ